MFEMEMSDTAIRKGNPDTANSSGVDVDFEMGASTDESSSADSSCFSDSSDEGSIKLRAYSIDDDVSIHQYQMGIDDDHRECAAELPSKDKKQEYKCRAKCQKRIGCELFSCFIYFCCFPCLIWIGIREALRGSRDPTSNSIKSSRFLMNKARICKTVRKLNTQLMRAVIRGDIEKVQSLLDDKANPKAKPDAMCHTRYFSASHFAALHDNELISILLMHGSNRFRRDNSGRTPLHIAAWSGNLKPLFALLGLPSELQNKLEVKGVTVEAEEDIKNFAENRNLKDMLAVICKNNYYKNLRIPKLLRDNIDHCCEKVLLPRFSWGWTPLHAAASSARALCCRVLLAAGADLCIRDEDGLTPLDVAGTDIYEEQPLGSTPVKTTFSDVINILANKQKRDGDEKGRAHPALQHISLVRRHTSLHVAVELESLEDIVLLLQTGVSPKIMNESGLTPFHLCIKKRNKPLLQVFLDYVGAEELRSPNYTPQCRDGYSVLHYAVSMNWLEGVHICFEAEAGANMKPANNGDTPLHTAASLGNLEILKAVLRYSKLKKMINKKNDDRETAIFKAIENGHTECVRMLLQEGASIKIASSWQYKVFHVAAERGHVDTLEVLLDHDKKFTRKNVDALTTDSRKFGPIHFAVENNNIECVNLLLSNNASISLKTGNNLTLLHIAASKNNLELVKFILKSQPSQIHNVDKMGWTPLHTASCIRTRGITRLLVLEGADLSARTTGPKKNNKTAIEMIMNNISKPTEFLESIFDMCIRTHRPNSVQQANELSFRDPDVEVIVDYSILLPKSETQNSNVKLKVIDALLDTGNSSGQKRLLIHPLVESFICLKWKALVPFFYVMLFIYSLFVLTLTTFVMIGFGYKDNVIDKPSVLNTTFWTYALYASIVMVLLQEVIFLTVNLKHYVLQIETWVKLASVILAMMLPKLMAKTQLPSSDSVDWIRHVATTAILMCWLHLIFLLSRFPKWGCYVLMFRKVLKNVLKILLTFSCLVFGFALSFMIQFHHEKHFASILTAFVKTMVMMTSEFDYDDLVVNKKTSHIRPLAVVVFLIFLILAAIVLMNLMVGVSVNDLNDLKVQGRVMQLEKQVEIVNSICCSLETLVFKRVFMKLLPTNWLEFSDKLIFKPFEPTRNSNRAIPKHVRDAIFKNAIAHEKNDDKHISFKSLMQLDEFRKFINDFEKLKKQLGDIHEHRDFKTQKKHVDDLKVKMGINADSDAEPRPSNQKELVINMPTLTSSH